MLKPALNILYLLNFVLICCISPQKDSSEKAGKKTDTTDVMTRIENLRQKGLLFDSCQFPYSGNCLYMLCASSDLIAEHDSLSMNKSMSSPVLVTYSLKPRILFDEKTKKAIIDDSRSFIIYSNVIFKEFPDTIQFDDFVNNDIRAAIDRGEVVSKVDGIGISESVKSNIYHFNLKNEQYIAVSYINVSRYIVMIVYSANGFENFRNNYSYFSDIIKSFKYFGD